MRRPAWRREDVTYTSDARPVGLDAGGRPPFVAHTDAQGDFVLEFPSGGDANVAFSAVDPLRSLVSPATEFALTELRNRVWVPLRMDAAATVILRAVDGTGRPVPRAECWLRHSAADFSETWRLRSFQPRSTLYEADDQGQLRLHLPAGKLRLWCRAPGSAFGDRRVLALAAGALVDMGDVECAAAASTLELRFIDTAGAPVPGVALRIESALAVPIPDESDRHDSWVHSQSDTEGRVRLTTRASDEPAIIGAVASGFRPLHMVVDVSGGGETGHDVVLERAAVVPIHVEMEGGGPLPEAAEFGISCHTVGSRLYSDEGQARIQWRELGPRADLSLRRRQMPENGPAASLLRRLFADGDTRREATGSYVLHLPEDGCYTISAWLRPCWTGTSTVTVVDGKPSIDQIRFEVPAGRWVRCTVRRESPDGAGLDSVLSEPVWIWPATRDLPPSDWPSNAPEAQDAVRSGVRAGDGSEESVGLWVPAKSTHLALARFAAPPQRSGARPPSGTPVDRTLALESAWLVPGANRRQAEVTIKLEFLRVRIPDGPRPEVTAVVPRSTVWPTLRTIRFQVSLDGEPLRARGVPVRLTALAVDVSYPTNHASHVVQVLRTDGDGSIEIRLPPGRYAALIDPAFAPRRRIRFNVSAGEESIVVQLPFVYDE